MVDRFGTSGRGHGRGAVGRRSRSRRLRRHPRPDPFVAPRLGRHGPRGAVSRHARAVGRGTDALAGDDFSLTADRGYRTDRVRRSRASRSWFGEPSSDGRGDILTNGTWRSGTVFLVEEAVAHLDQALEPLGE